MNELSFFYLVNNSPEHPNSNISKTSKKAKIENTERPPLKQKPLYRMPLKKKNIQATPVVQRSAKSTVKTSSIKKSALDSIRKGHAELCYTKETGLIYTSPNTIEMRDMNSSEQIGDPASPQPKLDDNEPIAQRLTFDSVHSNDSPLVQTVNKDNISINNKSSCKNIPEVD